MPPDGRHFLKFKVPMITYLRYIWLSFSGMVAFKVDSSAIICFKIFPHILVLPLVIVFCNIHTLFVLSFLTDGLSLLKNHYYSIYLCIVKKNNCMESFRLIFIIHLNTSVIFIGNAVYTL